MEALGTSIRIYKNTVNYLLWFVCWQCMRYGIWRSYCQFFGLALDFLLIWYTVCNYFATVKLPGFERIIIFFGSGASALLWSLTWFSIVKEEPSKDKHVSAAELHYLTTNVIKTQRARVIFYIQRQRYSGYFAI